VPLGKVTHFSCFGEKSITEARMNIGVLSPVKLIQSAVKSAGNNSEFMILDSPPGTSCPFVQTVSASDYVILVTEPTPFGLSDLRQSVDTLRGISKPFGVIINRTGIGNDNVLNYLEEQNIELLLEIPFSRKIAELYSAGKIVSEADMILSTRLFDIVMNLKRKYGNSGNKR
jgi:MinD superfamily P-loop ATPase